MINRIAFFAGKEDVENYFGLSTRKENLFESHYNISPGHYIPVVTKEDDEEADIKRVRWGKESNGKAESEHTAQVESAPELLKSKSVSRCVIPLSGFFVWKESREKEFPFFVRMLNKPFMTVAGLYYSKNDSSHVKLLVTESNALVQPMSPKMPVMFDKNLANKWLNQEESAAEIIEETKTLFLLTDLSVLRVSKKVNDPTNNNPELIQPIPK